MNLQHLLQAGRLTDEERKLNSTRPVHLTLVSFAVTRKAYEVITERFAEEYEEATGIPVKFRLSFGGSGTQVTASAILPASTCSCNQAPRGSQQRSQQPSHKPCRCMMTVCGALERHGTMCSCAPAFRQLTTTHNANPSQQPTT